MKTRISTLLAFAGIMAGILVYTACDDSSNSVKEPGTSSSSSSSSSTSSSGDPPVTFDAGKLEDGGQRDCFENPQTNFEIINGCSPEGTQRVDRRPTLTKLLADGGLPPLE